eukprot:jgi/Mesvir1/11002/Mv17942-RA.1
MEHTQGNAAVSGFMPASRAASVDQLRGPMDAREDAARMMEYETLQKRLLERDGPTVDTMWRLAAEQVPELSVASAGPLSSATCRGSAVEDSTCFSSGCNQDERVSSWDSDNSSISSHTSGNGPLLGMNKGIPQQPAGVVREVTFAQPPAAASLPFSEGHASGYLREAAPPRAATLSDCANEAGAVRERGVVVGGGGVAGGSNLDLDELLAVFGNPMPSVKQQQGKTPLARMWSQLSGKPAPSSWSAPTALYQPGAPLEASEYSRGGASFMSMGPDEGTRCRRGRSMSVEEPSLREESLASLKGYAAYSMEPSAGPPPPRPSASVDTHGYAGGACVGGSGGVYGAVSQGMGGQGGYSPLAVGGASFARKADGMNGVRDMAMTSASAKQSHTDELASIIRGANTANGNVAAASATPFAERKRQNVRYDTLAELIFPSLRNYALANQLAPPGARQGPPGAAAPPSGLPRPPPLQSQWDSGKLSALTSASGAGMATPRSYTELVAGLQQPPQQQGVAAYSMMDASMSIGARGADVISLASSGMDGGGSLCSGESQATTSDMMTMYNKRKPVESPFLQSLPSKMTALEVFQRGQVLAGNMGVGVGVGLGDIRSLEY